MKQKLEELVDLHGLSLAAAFRAIVLDHPSVVAAGRKVIEQTKGHASVFEQGQTPGPIVEYAWELDTTADNLAYQFVRPIMFFMDTPSPKASPGIVEAAIALASRIQFLRQLLIGGSLVAKGAYSQTGVTGEIGRLQWARQGVLIDVRNSDLVDIVNDKRTTRWTGIWVEVASAPTNRAASVQKAKVRVESSALATKECTRWLMDAMNTSPSVRQGTKQSWWDKANGKWPQALSRRGFDKAWADAVSRTKASVWAAAGAPRKSLRQSVR